MYLKVTLDKYNGKDATLNFSVSDTGIGGYLKTEKNAYLKTLFSSGKNDQQEASRIRD